MRRVLFATQSCYLDDSNGAAVACRAQMEYLARSGFAVEALSGTRLEIKQEVPTEEWLRARGIPFESLGGEAWTLDARGVRADVPPHDRLSVRGVSVTLHRSPSGSGASDSAAEHVEFLRLYEATLDRFRPEVVVNYGGNRLAQEIRSRARARGAAVVFALHNFGYPGPEPFQTADAVIVPSHFAAECYRKVVGLDCVVLPNLVDVDRVRALDRNPKYVTFVNPSREKGVYVFARIADELGRRRPDIPLLVVEGRGNERTLADCGLDLRLHGNVNLMAHTSDPRRFWRLSRLCLMPSLWWENQPLVAIEAMINGIPVIGSDRGGIPEALGNAGTVLPLPDRLTKATRVLPTAEEVAPWVEAIIQLWDDEQRYQEQSERARSEAERWSLERIGPRHEAFFREVRPGGSILAPKTHKVRKSGRSGRSYRVLIYRGTENLGDAIQTVAISRLLDGELRGVYRDEAGESIDAKAPFVINGWLGDRVTGRDRNCLFAGVHIGRFFEEHAQWIGQSAYEVGSRDDDAVERLAERKIHRRLSRRDIDSQSPVKDAVFLLSSPS